MKRKIFLFHPTAKTNYISAYSAFNNINPAILGEPGSPEIIGVPTGSVPFGSIIRLLCRSLGTSNETQLVWYSRSNIVDKTFYISDDYVINEYEFKASSAGLIDIQCRMAYPPTGLELYDDAQIVVQG